MASAFDDVKLLFDKASIQDNNVESREVFLHAADESLDGVVRAHLKRPHLDLDGRELGAELGCSVFASLDGAYSDDEVRQLEGEEMAARVEAEPHTGTGDDDNLAGKVDVCWKVHGLCELGLDEVGENPSLLGLISSDLEETI